MKHSISKSILRVILLVTLSMAGILVAFNISEAREDAYKHAQFEAFSAAQNLTNQFSGNLEEDIFENKGFQDAINSAMMKLVEENNLLFIYIGKPDDEPEVVRYYYLAGSEGQEDVVEEVLSNQSTEGRYVSVELLRVMNGESLREDTITNNKYGYVISTYVPLTDEKGEVIAVVGADVSMTTVTKMLLEALPFKLLATFAVGIISAWVLYHIMKKNVVQPIRSISQAMDAFGRDEKYETPDIGLRGDDEFGLIEKSFDRMAEKIRDNVSRLREYTEIQSRQAYELQTAARIQKGFLPEEHFENDFSEIHASMTAAKNVGGDFYDYFEDHGHMVLVVADVSGKGLSGAIFMAGAINLLRGVVKQGLEPHEVLMAVNGELEQNNPNGLFVTLFLAYVDETKGLIRYASAGHNPPYLLSDGQLRILKGSGGVPLGVLDDETYETAEEIFPLGSTLFLYTDGVTEAVSGSGAFFGTDRLEAVLRKNAGDEAIGAVQKELEAFTAGCEQWDDITMLTLTSRSETLRLPAEKEAYAQLKAWILEDPAMPDSIKKIFCLMAEEIFINIASYAYNEGENGEVMIRRQIQNDSCLLQFTDSGKPFDQTQNVQDMDEYDPFEQVGGLGRFMVQSLADEWRYERIENHNVLLVIKNGSAGR